MLCNYPGVPTHNMQYVNYVLSFTLLLSLNQIFITHAVFPLLLCYSDSLVTFRTNFLFPLWQEAALFHFLPVKVSCTVTVLLFMTFSRFESATWVSVDYATNFKTCCFFFRQRNVQVSLFKGRLSLHTVVDVILVIIL